MSSIVTFYSYKGGVGRSMALANIAVELSKRKKRVLMVDWDLEAPGLERYFSNFTIENFSEGEGLLSLLLDLEKGNEPDYRNYLWTIKLNSENNLFLLHSGRENDSIKYSANLEKFGWHDFFENNHGGMHLENLRKAWLRDFDIVLIDSRTGLSDASGICTIMLPDILIPMFTANYQSLFGIRDIVKYIQASRQKLSIDRMALTILPIPSRFGTKVEFKESQEWLDRIADLLKECFIDWLPKWIEPRYVLEQIKIPQVDYFSFGEKLSVLEHGTNDPESMGFIYSKIANLLANDFSDLENFIGAEYYQSRKNTYDQLKLNSSIQTKESNEFKYDLFVSCHKNSYQWVRELLVPALMEYLPDDLNYTPKIYYDYSETNKDDSFFLNTQNAIQKSKSILLVYSSSELKNEQVNYGLSHFENRERVTKKKLIHQIIYKKDNSDFISEPGSNGKNIIDLSMYNYEDTYKSTKLRTLFGNEIEKLSREISISINDGSNLLNGELAINQIQNEIEVLASEYESLRDNMKSGNNRTILMENIVTEMKKRADEITPILNKYTQSSSPGKRLVAIATLQAIPKIDYVNWLANHVGDAEKPFIGYQASVGIYIASRTFGKEHKIAILDAINLAFDNLYKYEFKDPNQISVLNSAKSYIKMN